MGCRKDCPNRLRRKIHRHRRDCRYGDRRDSLTQELRVLNSELAKVNDPKYGSVYRYLLRNMPTDKSVFVSIAALHSAGTDGEAVSAPSAVFEVK